MPTLQLHDRIMTESRQIEGLGQDADTVTLAQLIEDFRGYGQNARELVASSNVAIPLTGTTDETLLVAVALPPLGPNDQVMITALWSYPNSGNIKVPRIRFHTASGTGGTLVGNLSLTTTASVRMIVEGGNRGATNSQFWGSTTGGTAASSGAIPTTSLDTTVTTYLNFTGDLADVGETITLESYRVEILRV